MRKPIGRPKDKHWNDVKKIENGKWQCKYCPHEFSGNISVTRIRAHLYKETGHGTAPCSFHRDINEGAHNNLSSSSSNPQEHVNTLQGIDGGSYIENMPTEIVGYNFAKNLKKLWELLFDDQVFIIGVYGMGGVGKTLLATHLENEIKRKGSFKDVFWVTVSHNFSTSKLQHDISKRMGVKLDEDDEKIRAEILSSALETREKPILILDDVWKYINLEKVGIRRNLNGIKVILTTRLKHVCQQMDCLPNNMIQMLPLDYYNEAEDEEAEELFKVKLGHNGTPATLTPEVEEIATRIVRGCGGLPLGISVMARTLKGSINDIHRWKYALNKLEKMEMEQEVEEEVFKVLKRSYDNLVEKDLQNCFLYCALFPYFKRHELILKLLDIGLLEGRRSLEEIFCKGNNILDKLIDHSLLQEIFSGFYVSPFVRVMASNILKESQRCVLVKFLKEKTYFQKELTIQEWKDLKFVNLMIYTDVEEITEDTSPHCPHLSTLIIVPYDTDFGEGVGIDYFPKCFFKNMNALTVLDLSGNSELTSLPESLSDLRSLVSLTLRGCDSLKYVPPLEKLQALSRLDISHCSIEQVPQGLEKIINLKWLDLNGNEELSMEPGFVDVLPNFTSMQYLDLRDCPHVKIKVEDVQGMNRLECLGGTFLDSQHYNRYMEILLDQSFGPKTYTLSLEKSDDWEEDYPMLPNNQRDLHLHDNNQWICLCGALSSKAASSLNKIQVDNCKQLESVFCLSGSCFVCIDFCKLEFLHLRDLESLTVIYKVDVVDFRQFLSMRNKFPCLTYLDISGCHEIKKLLTPWLVLQLPNLERITVSECNSMEEIIAVGNGGDNDGSSITLPKLTRLELWYLPQLKIVCKEYIIFGSSPTYRVKCCPNLEWDHPAFPLKLDSFGSNF